MTAYEWFMLATVAGLAAWGGYTVFGSMHHDRRWPDHLRMFAGTHHLKESRSKGPPALRVLTWRDFRDRFSRNPALRHAATGTVVLKGQMGRLPLAVDQVFVRSRFGGAFDAYIRLWVEPASLPGELRVSPASRLRRGPLVIKYPADGSQRARAEAFLSRERLKVLENAQLRRSGVYVAGGRLFLIGKRRRRQEIDLEELYARLRELVKALSLC